MLLFFLRKKILILLVLSLMLCSHGKDFIHGIYAVPVNEGDIARVKELGFNYMQCYINPHTEKGHDNAEKQLKLAEKYGLKVIFDVYARVLVGKKDAVPKLMRMIQDFKESPALGAWYLFDEPSRMDQKNDLQLFYSILKRETPDIPVLLCLCQNKQWKQFIEPCDILMGDHYPVKDEPFPEAPLHYYTNFLRDMSRYNKPFLPIPQFMCWSAYPDVVKEFDKKSLRYPNETEMRCFFYAPLAMGNMRGIVWYSYYDAFYKGKKDGQKNSTFRTALRPLIQEFNEFIALLKDPARPRILRWSEDNQFQMALFEGKDAGRQYIVLVNLWPVKRRFDRWTENIIPDNVKLKPWKFTRNISAEVTNGKFVLDGGWMEPWETMIWEVEAAAK